MLRLPAMPFASIATMSLVLIWPSTVIRLKEFSTDFLIQDFSVPRETEASVVIKQNIVAMFGAIMPEPLAIAPIVTSLLSIRVLTAVCLGGGVRLRPLMQL